MTKGTRNTLLLALFAAVLGAGELVAYQGIAPHARKLGDSGRVALRAGGIVARDLSALAVERAQHVTSLVALHGVRQTSRIYRLAGRAFGVNETVAPASGHAAPGCEAVVAGEPDVATDPVGTCDRVVASERVAAGEPDVATEAVVKNEAVARSEAVVASDPVRMCKAARAAGMTCPACPGWSGRSAATHHGARSRQVLRRIWIKV